MKDLEGEGLFEKSPSPSNSLSSEAFSKQRTGAPIRCSRSLAKAPLSGSFCKSFLKLLPRNDIIGHVAGAFGINISL
jgi:hypothetical protein